MNNQSSTELFKGYNYLIYSGRAKVADRIIELLNTDLEDLETERPLQQDSIEEFIDFCKLGYFQVNPNIGVNHYGYICADWNLKDTSLISIVFKGDKNVTLRVSSDKINFSKYIRFSSIIPQLKNINAPAI